MPCEVFGWDRSSYLDVEWYEFKVCAADPPPLRTSTGFWIDTPYGLERRADGTTRLLVRERAIFGTKAARLVFSPVGFVSFVMMQKMMRGIKARAEARRARATDSSPASKQIA